MIWQLQRKAAVQAAKSAPPTPKTATFEAKLDAFANKLNITPQLKAITLDTILSGETCPPIGWVDFHFDNSSLHSSDSSYLLL
jgi:hypothetical protein